jgi:hypothetical protein
MICQEIDRILLPEKLIEGSISAIELQELDDEGMPISSEKEYCTPRIVLSYNSQKFREALAIYSLYQTIGREQTWEFINQIYSEKTIEVWIKIGKNLALNHCALTIPRYAVREKVRRRGYAHTSNDPNSLRSQKGRISKMMTNEQEIQELEATISRIKVKQAQLFERRLDALLAIQSEIPKEIKREVFQSLVGNTLPVEGEDPNKYEINPITERRDE